MIYTVTFNPALDYITKTKHFQSGATNRTCSEIMNPGGKGINVSLVLRNLGIKSTALLFIAGFTGEELVRKLSEEQIQTDIIKLNQGMTRINVKIRSVEERMHNESESLIETELNGMGPKITEDAMKTFYEKIRTLSDGDILVLSGSIPSDMPKTLYAEIMEYMGQQNPKVKVVVDATGELLTKTLPYHPFLIKPNNHELEDIFGVTLTTKEEIIFYARELQKQGAVNVLVSMAGDGAVLVSEGGEFFETEAPKGIVRNSVGAGDSMVAGFLAGYEEKRNYEDAFRMGVCTGSASAFSEGMATKEMVEELLRLKR